MIKRLYILVAFIFLSFPFAAFATHIVGGSLTYVYNGGSSYTVTLKLYRDCSPTSAAFPGSVTINVAGYDGAAFTPSKDFTMNLGTVTAVPPVLDPCAIPPSPMPCVQQGVYTATVNNLPPNPGGYHLSYQVIARNLSLSNVNAACNCVGESFYAYIPGQSVRWFENFTLANGTTSDAGATAWTIAAGVPPPASASVNSNVFEITGANNARETWTSQTVNISSCSSSNVRVDLSENGTLDANDSIFVYYRLNGGPLTLFPTNGFIADDFTNAIASVSGLSGTTVQVIIRVHYDASSPASEIYRFDNVAVSCNDFLPNSNPVFNLFPPLFLCVGQPFTFDHSATDIDGDSLYYSFYTPYNGDNGVGPLDPTYSSNTAIFTPIVWLPGYSATNPLGGPPLNLNPSTGLLTGTPTMIGQFVVGVIVKEYRNGNYMSQTLRDFQFNIVNCPAPLVTTGGNDITINDGCIGHLNATGYNAPTVSWHSIAPGAPGAYNSYLSCTTGCVNPTVQSSGMPPAFVDYVICGISSTCNPTTICDTVRVNFNPTLAVTIIPANPTICFGQTSTVITAVGSGGTPPYSYLWNSVNPTQSITVGAGTYNVVLSDASGCPPTSASVTVTSFSVAITANAGADDTVCAQSPIATLNGAVTGASGGIWSGGAGTFSPNNTTLSGVNYIPTAAEIAAGFVNLTLTTTGNGTCPGASDVVKIFFMNFTGTASTSVVNVSCFGNNNGSATASVTGGTPPYSYLWNTVPSQNTATAINLAPGTYSVTITNGFGCSTQTSATIAQPAPLALSRVITNVSCFGGSTGSIAVTPSGGTTPYTYSWSPGGATTATITGKPAGSYTVTVTDARGCTATATYSITQPTAIAATITKTNVNCNGTNDGSATASVTGGTAPYGYSWSPSGGTAATATGLGAGTYTVTVTDSKGCTATNTAVITQPAALTATTASTNETCNTLDNGTASVMPVGGTPGYTYLWMPGGMTTSTVSGLASGNYTVTVTDSKGCSATAFAVITQPTALNINFVNQINVSCFGGNNGSVKGSPSGGTGPYTYSWMPGGMTTQVISGLAAGTYTLTVTDNNGCQVVNSVSITEPASAVSATATIVNVSCSGGNTGSISLVPAGGTPGYTYLWAPGGATTASITGKPAGTYTVTVRDSKACLVTYTFTITQPAPIAVSIAKTNITCNGFNDGTATAIPTGGTAPYTYNWMPSGGTGATASGLAVGTYTVFVTDSKGCTKTAATNISQPPVLNVTATSTAESCTYLNNGSASATSSGGTPGYSYSWAPGGQTTNTITGQASGTYTVTSTDTKGCTATTAVIITEPVPLAITFSSLVSVSCFGGSNGSVSATPSGGTPNYTYSWAPGGATTSTVTGLAAGTYTLTVTDNRGCQVVSTVTITQPAAPVSIAVSSTPTSCPGGNNGTVTANGAGGTGPYTYVWMPGSIPGSTVSGLSPGTYTVTATDSRGCTSTNTVAVTQPAAMTLTISTVNSNCGTPSGQATVTVSGGAAPYNYSWSPSGGSAATATGLISSAYTVLVTDNNGCSATQWANINDNSGPTATIFSIINVSCNGGSDGSASVGVSGGTGPFTYTWTPFGGSAPTASGLSAGTYTVTVLDANGCQSNATTSPDILQPPPIVISIASTNVSCFGGNNGTASATVSGGTPGYTYLWSPGGATTPSVTNLAAGTYTLQVKDANNCIQVSAFNITQPAANLSVAVSATPVSCFAGSTGTVSATASGGTAPYNYSWTPGGFSGAGISNLPAGTYTVNVTDLNGCTTSNSVTVTQPAAVVLVSGSTNSNCSTASGMAYVSASGGISPYTYLWNPGSIANDTAGNILAGIYTVNVTDNNGCVSTASAIVNDNPSPAVDITATTNVSCNGGNNGSATATVTGGAAPFSYSWSPLGGTAVTTTGIPAGTYTITVTDANGCTALDTTSPAITEPPALSANISTTDASCNGNNNGTAAISAHGGTPGYSYQWFPGGATGSSSGSLTAGTYTVITTDTNACVLSSTFTITQPAVLNAVISSSANVSCFGGSNGTATVNVTGGTPFYNFTWLPYGGSNATASGLSAGTFTVNITDLQGCTTSATVVITQPSSALSASANGNPTSCSGGGDGSATVTPSGGTPGYSYQWLPSGGTASMATGLSPGVYTVLVTDTNGCSVNIAVAISQPTALIGTLSVTQPSCGFNNGSLSAMVSGGTGPYTYLWSPGGATTATVSGLAPGNYTVQVTDASNCVSTLSATLINIAGPSVSIASTTLVSCYNGNNGTATASVTSGTAPFDYNWLPAGGSGITGTSLPAGSYTITVTDSLGCIGSAIAVVNEPPPIVITVSSLNAVSCNGGSNGSITVNPSGGTPGYTYSWAPVVSGAPGVSGLTAGTYTVNVADLNGCPAAISINITEPAMLLSSMGSVVNASCYASTNGSATVVPSGGTIPYSFLWSDGQTGSTATNIGAGSYSVTITDANGCTTTNNTVVTQPTQVITSAGPNDTICLGSSGVVTATATGGAGGYYYAWQPSGTINSGSFTISPTTNTTYTVVAYDMDGCAGTSDTVSAIVYSLSGADVDAVTLVSPICPGQSTTVSVLVTGSTGPLTYSWNYGLGNSPGPITVSPGISTTYIVSVTNSCGTTVMDSIPVIISPPPTVLFTSDSNVVCIPSVVQFYDNSLTGNPLDPIHTWLWNFGDGTTSGLDDPSHVYTTSGTYYVSLTVTTGNGCTNSSTSPLVINAYPFPVAAFSLNSTVLDLPYDVLVCTNMSVGATSYNWSFGDGATSTATNPSYLYSTVGTFPVQLIATSALGCADTAYAEVTTSADIVFPNVFTPNPDGSSGGTYDIASLTNDVFFPYTSGVVDFELQIFNRWGELIFETFDIKQGWDGYYRGKICQQDVYIWKAKVKLNNGKEFNKTGDVTLLR
jgi:gliding motility-associated-like protein